MMRNYQINDVLKQVSICAGAAGMDIGGHANGMKTEFACDLAVNSQKFFKNNFPAVPFGLMDMRMVDLEVINLTRAAVNQPPLQRGEIHVLTAGSPCVKMSMCNSTDRRIFAPENLLLTDELPRIVHDLQPKIAWFENTDNLMSEPFYPVLLEFETSVASLLPNYWLFTKVVNAKNYEARQSRSRTMIVLIRKDVGTFKAKDVWPARIPVDLSKVGVNVLLPWVDQFSGGQFEKKWRDATGKIFCTLTKGGSELVRVGDIVRPANVNERLILSDMLEFIFDGISDTGIKGLCGNMVMRQLAFHMMKHFRERILKAGPFAGDKSMVF